MRALNISLRLAALAVGLTLSMAARADGIVTKPAALAPEARASLAKQIEAYRASNPEAFEAVKNVKGHRPEGYKDHRNPFPTAARELRGLGAAALLPMLEALAFEAPARGDLSDAEWDALATGMLDAVGLLRDARSGPVLAAVFEAGQARPAVLAAAARAMGRLGGDAELASLIKHSALNDPLRAPAIEGLGQLRRIESAKHLASLLAAAKDDASIAAIAEAMGALGSSWAWKALGPQAQATGLAVREICAKALVPGLVRGKGAARDAARDALVMVEHPTAITLLQSARPAADADTVRVIDTVIQRLQRTQSK